MKIAYHRKIWYEAVISAAEFYKSDVNQKLKALLA